MFAMGKVERLFKYAFWHEILRLWRAISGLFWAVNIRFSTETKPSLPSQPETIDQDITEVSDQLLIDLCLTRSSKDDRPFRELFRRHKATVWHVCYSFVRNQEDAEDLTQEVFFRAYRSLAQFEGRSSLKTWLYRIATNVSQNEIRRRSRRPQESQTSMDVLGEVLPAKETTPEAHAIAQSQKELLAQALASLKPAASEALKLKDLEQRPYIEIAEMLGISQSAAKMRVQRARLALVEAYQQLGEGIEP